MTDGFFRALFIPMLFVICFAFYLGYSMGYTTGWKEFDKPQVVVAKDNYQVQIYPICDMHTVLTYRDAALIFYTPMQKYIVTAEIDSIDLNDCKCGMRRL